MSQKITSIPYGTFQRICDRAGGLRASNYQLVRATRQSLSELAKERKWRTQRRAIIKIVLKMHAKERKMLKKLNIF